MILKTIHKVLVLVLVLYSCISYSAGVYPFEQSIINKEFLPNNNGLKYTIVSIILSLLLTFAFLTVRYTFQVDDVKVLLSTV